MGFTERMCVRQLGRRKSPSPPRSRPKLAAPGSVLCQETLGLPPSVRGGGRGHRASVLLNPEAAWCPAVDPGPFTDTGVNDEGKEMGSVFSDVPNQ